MIIIQMNACLLLKNYYLKRQEKIKRKGKRSEGKIENRKNGMESKNMVKE